MPAPRSDTVDPEAWATLLDELLAASGLTPETAVAPRGPLHLTPQTIYRWRRRRQMGTKAHQVVSVCRDLGYPPLHGLVRVGFLTADEAGIAGPSPVATRDPVLGRISRDLNDPRLPEVARGELRRSIHDAHQTWLRHLKTFAQRPRDE